MCRDHLRRREPWGWRVADERFQYKAQRDERHLRAPDFSGRSTSFARESPRRLRARRESWFAESSDLDRWHAQPNDRHSPPSPACQERRHASAHHRHVYRQFIASAYRRVSHADRLLRGRSTSVAAPNRSRVPGGLERTRRLLRLLPPLRFDGRGDAVVAVGLWAVLLQEGRDVGRNRVRHRPSLQAEPAITL